jgi:hypothetical protein
MRERKGEYFLIHKRAIARDSWTGGTTPSISRIATTARCSHAKDR